MTRWREIGWWSGGLLGGGIGVVAEWTWQGGWPVQLWACGLAIFLAVAFAGLGTYIVGFWEDTRGEAREA